MSNAGWVGVDLDGTLAYYDHWRGSTVIGEPVPSIQRYVRELLYLGVEVRIFTARVQEGAKAIAAIEEWCVRHLGQVLPVTNVKDMNMVFMLDDRAVSIEANTGRFLVEPPSIEEINNHWNADTAPPKEFKRD